MFLHVRIGAEWHRVGQSPAPRKGVRAGNTLCGKSFSIRLPSKNLRNAPSGDAQITCSGCKKP